MKKPIVNVIKCPKCDAVQIAINSNGNITTEDGAWSCLHTCDQCGHVIGESLWDLVEVEIHWDSARGFTISVDQFDVVQDLLMACGNKGENQCASSTEINKLVGFLLEYSGISLTVT